MFNKWQQVEDWITDNRFKRWIFYKNDPEKNDDRCNNKIIDSKFWSEETPDEKLRLTRKYLEQWGGRAYGLAFQNESATSGGAQCVVYIEAAQPAQQPIQQAPVAGMSIGATDVEQLKQQIREQVQTEFEKREYEKQRKELDEEKREFERDKNSAIGLMVGYLKPVISALGQKRVAGLDAEEDVRAERVAPIAPKQEQPDEVDVEQSVFTEEESEELYALMAQFKQVEPEYLRLLKAVVKLAETGDKNYQMARMMLLGQE